MLHGQSFLDPFDSTQQEAGDRADHSTLARLPPGLSSLQMYFEGARELGEDYRSLHELPAIRSKRTWACKPARRGSLWNLRGLLQGVPVQEKRGKTDTI